MVKFGRVLTAMITPFKEDGSVNYAVAEQLAVHLADRGTDSLVVRHNGRVSYYDLG